MAGLFCVLALFSCERQGDILASVNESELTKEDAFVIMKHLGYNPYDEASQKKFVEYWINKEIVKEEIKKNHPDDWQLMELRSKDYQGDLAQIYLQEKNALSALDTIITNEHINAYYNEHIEEFKLNDYLVKGLYLKIPISSEYKKDLIHYRYLLKNDKDVELVISYAKLYAENFYYEDSSWTYFKELASDLPTDKMNVDKLIQNRSKTYFHDNEYYYFINIQDFKLKDDAPPVEFLEKEIKRAILSNRLEKIIEDQESQWIERLKKEHEININL